MSITPSENRKLESFFDRKIDTNKTGAIDAKDKIDKEILKELGIIDQNGNDTGKIITKASFMASYSELPNSIKNLFNLYIQESESQEEQPQKIQQEQSFRDDFKKFKAEANQQAGNFISQAGDDYNEFAERAMQEMAHFKNGENGNSCDSPSAAKEEESGEGARADFENFNRRVKDSFDNTKTRNEAEFDAEKAKNDAEQAAFKQSAETKILEFTSDSKNLTKDFKKRSMTTILNDLAQGYSGSLIINNGEYVILYDKENTTYLLNSKKIENEEILQELLEYFSEMATSIYGRSSKIRIS